MSWLHLDDHYVQRTQGGNAIACAAYIDTLAYHDERTGKTFCYGANTSKSGKETEAMRKRRTTIRLGTIIPDGKDAIAYDTATLWNTIEKKQPINGQPAEVIEASLPTGLPTETYIEIGREFAKNLAQDGSAVTIAIHMDHKGNPHLHAMKSNQPVSLTATGAIQLGKKFRTKAKRDKMIMQKREAIAAICNRHLPPEQHISPYSYAIQGIGKIPTKHYGAATIRDVRRGKLTDRARRISSHNQAAKQANTAKNEIAAIDAALAQSRRMPDGIIVHAQKPGPEPKLAHIEPERTKPGANLNQNRPAHSGDAARLPQNRDTSPHRAKTMARSDAREPQDLSGRDRRGPERSSGSDRPPTQRREAGSENDTGRDYRRNTGPGDPYDGLGDDTPLQAYALAGYTLKDDLHALAQDLRDWQAKIDHQKWRNRHGQHDQHRDQQTQRNRA